jgi:hypothetical protein
MLSGFRNLGVRFVVLAACVLITGATVHAQANVYGGITGSVLDAQKKAIVGASVTVRNAGTDVTAPATETDSDGKFTISTLQPGTYEVSVTAPNFAATKLADVIVEVGKTTPVEIQLGVAGQAQNVQVVATAPMVNTESNDISTDITKSSIDNLPLNYRRWSYFTVLTPGAIYGDTFGDVAFLGIGYIFDNNTIDGADNNEYFFASEKGRTRIAYSTSLNAIQEFQVAAADYSAEYGRAAAGLINAVTKSGSNTLHGSAYYYNRDLAIGGAYSPFVSGSVETSPGVYATEPIKPEDIRSQYGGDVGGWFLKNKLFWYFNYDGFYRDFPLDSVPNSPNTFYEPITVAAPTSSCSAINGQLADETSVNSGTAIGNALYCRIFNGGTATTSQIATAQTQVNAATNLIVAETGLFPRTGAQTLYYPKVDWHVDSHDTITVSWNRMRWASPYGIQTGTTVADGQDYLGNDYVKDDTGIARLVSVIGANFTNDLRFSYGRDFEFETQTPPVAGEPDATATGLPPQIDLDYPGISGTAFSFGTYFNLPRIKYPDETKYEYSDTASIISGKHFLKFGGDIERTNDTMINLVDQYGEYSYGNLADWISDYIGYEDDLNPGGCTGIGTGTCAYGSTAGLLCTSTSGGVTYYNNCYHEYFQGFGPNRFAFHTWDVALFGQDDIHLTRRFTLDLGLRWEHEVMPQPQLPSTLIFTSDFPKDYHDYGPRVGLAYDIFGNGKTVLRGGYGIYYGRISNEQIYDAIIYSGNLLSQLEPTIYPTTGNSHNNTGTPACESLSGTTCEGYAPHYPQIITAPFTNTPTLNAEYFAPDDRLPLVSQYDAVLEHEIAKNTVISISYVGTDGRFLPLASNFNLAPPGSLQYTISAGVAPPTANIGGIAPSKFPATLSTYTVPFFYETSNSNGFLNPSFGDLIEVTTNVRSNYNSMVLQFNRRMTSGLEFQMNYTWSHAIDDDQQTSPAFAASTNDPGDPYDIALDKGNSPFDIRQRFIASIVWQPDFFHNRGKFVHYALDGWTIAPIQTVQNGLPYSATVSGSTLSSIDYAVSGVEGSGGSTRVPFLPRDWFHMPSVINTDIRLARSFTIKENYRITLSAEAFNLFNELDVTAVNTELFSNCTSTTATNCGAGGSTGGTLVYNPAFGDVTAANNSTTQGVRSLQFGARFEF